MGYLELGILFGASVGAALLLGTAAAVLTYRRKGTFPGQPEDATETDTAAALRGARQRMVLGATLTVVGLVTLVAVLT